MRILHTMLRVGDLDRSIKFYTEVLGMRLLRKKDYPDGYPIELIGKKALPGVVPNTAIIGQQ